MKFIIGLAVGFTIGLFVGLLIGAKSMYDNCTDQTVKAGKAEYYLDENNERQWRWKK